MKPYEVRLRMTVEGSIVLSAGSADEAAQKVVLSSEHDLNALLMAVVTRKEVISVEVLL